MNVPQLVLAAWLILIPVMTAYEHRRVDPEMREDGDLAASLILGFMWPLIGIFRISVVVRNHVQRRRYGAE